MPYVQACGSVFDSGTATHHLTLYRHASGALVFGAGTVQWAWGLDAHHDTETGVPPERVNENTTRVGVDPNGPDRNIRQATVNLFADMGVQPATLAPDLVRAQASEDREPPVSRIDEPRTGSSLPPGPVQISGASHDCGGGCVAAVEVSVDGGATWHPVEGRESWRYEWKPEGSGTRTILCRAVDDSGNLEAPAAGVTVTVSVERYGIGFTDIVKRPTAGCGEFRPREFREGALSDPTGPLWHLAARIVKERGRRHSSHGATEWKPAYSEEIVGVGEVLDAWTALRHIRLVHPGPASATRYAPGVLNL